MTVGELKAILNTLDDQVEVSIQTPQMVVPVTRVVDLSVGKVAIEGTRESSSPPSYEFY